LEGLPLSLNVKLTITKNEKGNQEGNQEGKNEVNQGVMKIRLEGIEKREITGRSKRKRSSRKKYKKKENKRKSDVRSKRRRKGISMDEHEDLVVGDGRTWAQDGSLLCPTNSLSIGGLPRVPADKRTKGSTSPGEASTKVAGTQKQEEMGLIESDLTLQLRRVAGLGQK